MNTFKDDCTEVLFWLTMVSSVSFLVFLVKELVQCTTH